MHPLPHPPTGWPKLKGSDLSWQAALRQAIAAVDWLAVSATCKTVLGARLDIAEPTLEASPADAFETQWTGNRVALALEGVAAGAVGVVVLEVSGAFARVIVDRALGGEGADDCDPLSPALDGVSQGVLGYVVARALAATRSDYKLRDATVASDIARRWLGEGRCAVFSFAVMLDESRDVVRLWMNEASAQRTVAAAWPPIAATASIAGDVPVTLRAIAARDQLALDELTALQTGDLVVLSACALRLSDNAWHGEARLYVGALAGTWFACTVSDTAIEISTALQHASAPQPTGMLTMGETTDTPTLDLAHLAHLLVDIEVELARFTLSVADISAMAPGDVMRVGKPVGSHVLLTAGGQSVAEAELVDVDGEVGVRIVRLLGARAR